MTKPFWDVNILTGSKTAKLIDDPEKWAKIIKKAANPLYVLGPDTVTKNIGDKLMLEYCLDLAKAADLPICATAHVRKKMLEMGVEPDSIYDIIEIVNHLKDPEWQGVKKRGNHDLIIFTGVRCDLAERGLATLKHFADHLKTAALCRYSHPNADFALPVIRRDEKWEEYFNGVVVAFA
ncbi:CO dehydrogenase/acetyl-CoA synthase complex subunit epsilon [Candidatus Bipolaricaulota bacterium]|nr:CO dehydrogenase/acetyl-CoA synthase complex subunit epsilon [Candidatus Bipolaricaulota bacterium]